MQVYLKKGMYYMKTHHFGRLIIAVLALIAIAGLTVSPVAAAHPQFRKVSSAIVGTAGMLQVSWTELGLGSSQVIDYHVSAKVTAVYVCINKAGIQPNAANKKTVYGPV